MYHMVVGFYVRFQLYFVGVCFCTLGEVDANADDVCSDAVDKPSICNRRVVYNKHRMDPEMAESFKENLLDEEKLKDITAADGTLPGGAFFVCRENEPSGNAENGLRLMTSEWRENRTLCCYSAAKFDPQLLACICLGSVHACLRGVSGILPVWSGY